MYFVHAGAITMYVDGSNCHIVAGSAMLLQPGRRHAVYSTTGASVIKLHFKTSRASHDLAALRAMCGRILRFGPYMREALLMLGRDGGMANTSVHRTRMMFAVLDGLLESMMGGSGDGTGGGALRPGRSELLEKASACTERSLGGVLSAGMVARECGVSEATLRREFRRKTGTTFSSFLLGKRMEKAARLLVEERMPVKRVAYECGFRYPEYFVRKFKGMYGITPGAFRSAERTS